MYNVHPYFPFKNLGKNVCIIPAKYGIFLFVNVLTFLPSSLSYPSSIVFHSKTAVPTIETVMWGTTAVPHSLRAWAPPETFPSGDII